MFTRKHTQCIIFIYLSLFLLSCGGGSSSAGGSSSTTDIATNTATTSTQEPTQPSGCSSTCSAGDPINEGNGVWRARDASCQCINSAIEKAQVGDTIIVSGNATWSNTLSISKGINLVGSGNPTITSTTTAIYWTPSSAAQSAHNTLTINGFTFDGNNSNFGGAGMIRVNNTSTVNYVNLIIKNNTLKNIAASGRGLYLAGTIYGVATSNTFDRVAILFGAYGNDFNSWSNQTQAYGVSQNFYFEDNTILFSSYYSSGYAGWTEAGQGGRVVVRYNSWDYYNVASPGEFWDVHGLQTPLVSGSTSNCQNYSTMVAEYYGNRITNQTGAYRWMAHRGGWMVMFYNTLSGTTTPYNGITQYYCNSCGSGGFNQKATNSYYWSNLANGTERQATYYDPGTQECTSDPLIENTDYFNYNASFTGTSGIGCGTLANRPTSCNTGTAYWATNQSCHDLTGTVGSKPTTPISGTLYKCSSTNTWTAYYTPYTYPHPLSTK